MEDTSLDEFLDSGEDDTDADVTPAKPTYCWSPDSEVCAACGEAASRRWQSEAGPVCPECKEW